MIELVAVALVIAGTVSCTIGYIAAALGGGTVPIVVCGGPGVAAILVGGWILL
jgi:hypothetical protein